jgi:amino-acid N-acetyltransferase
MNIRKATAKDWPHVLRLIREHPSQLIQDHLPRPHDFFVAVEENNIVGCCALEVYSKRLAEIRSLAVAKKHQGKGIATLLVERCMQEARKKKVYEVLSITGALPFFKKRGFNTFNKEKYALLKILG